ncbi:radical SAM protein [Bacillus paranthracis]|uniref:radical SAM protein n=1 Tax=Bacillus paranthracis TaxID=2026186 RepID=UPI00163F3337
MFVKLEDEVYAKFEPSNKNIYVLCENELYTLDNSAPSYNKIIKLLPQKKWDKSFLSTPFNVQIQVTKGCNFSCSFCYANAVRGAKNLDMPIEKLKHLIDQLFEWGVPNVQYVGGETFFHNDFPKIVDYAHSLGMSQSLITNAIIPGSLPKKYKDTLKKFSKIQVSMNGVDDVYNNSVQTKIFDKFLKAAQNIAEINNNVWISCVLTEQTINQIGETFEASKKIGVKGIRFGALAKQGRGSDFEFEYFRKILPKAEEEIKKHMSNFPELIIDSLFNPLLSHNFVDGDKSPQLKYHSEGQSVLFISVEGDVYPFPLLELPEFNIGNVFKEDISVLWENSSILNEMRDFNNLNEHCRNCETPCSFSSRSMTYLWTGSISKKNPML